MYIYIADLESDSQWSVTKAKGELAVKEEFPEAIIVRASTVFGPEDRFLNWIAEASKKVGFFPLLNGGSALVQPIYCNDLAKAMMAIVYRHDEFKGKTFQLAGPEEYNYKEIVEFVLDITAMDTVRMIDVPIGQANFVGSLMENIIHPFFTVDNIAQVIYFLLLLIFFLYLGLSSWSIWNI
jgi:dTDP-4-dehydrorhamnose reductase